MARTEEVFILATHEVEVRAQELGSTRPPPASSIPHLSSVDSSGEARAEVDDELLVVYQASSGAERERLKAEIVERMTGLVRFLVRRYAGRGESYDDLLQVGMLGLLGAIDRFEPERGVRFASFARPSIVGEVKRHFRDKTWAARVPRRLQELSLSVSAAEAELFQEHGRSPTALEVAERVGATEEEVLEANEAARSYSAVSIDQPLDSGDGETGSLADLIGGVDRDLEKLENLTALEPAIAQLTPNDRRLLQMRFFRGMVQSDIAAELGVSQMQVSRQLARVLARLRGSIT
ncbi:MAG: SigB/SigF/SigG family RNA polymerase sigma factor [Actinomycetota bacterium]